MNPQVRQERDRRYKIFRASPELILQAMMPATGTSNDLVTIEGLPDGYELCDVAYCWESRCFMFRVWHESFDIVPECCMIPAITPTVHVKRRHSDSPIRFREFT